MKRYKISLGPNMFRRFRTKKVRSKKLFKRAYEKAKFRKALEEDR